MTFFWIGQIPASFLLAGICPICLRYIAQFKKKYKTKYKFMFLKRGTAIYTYTYDTYVYTNS